MSKSLKRVSEALAAAGVAPDILEMPGETRTAEQAARAAGCALDQIAKSIIFRGEDTGHIVLFLTAGGNRVSPEKASRVAGQRLGKADAELVRAETGFAIGGVAPVGHTGPVQVFIDADLRQYKEIWAAAGSSNAVFRLTPADLERITGGRVIAVK